MVSDLNSGTISATIPAGTAPGAGYRIRVISSNPVVTGSANSANLSLVSPTVNIGAPLADICEQNTSTPLGGSVGGSATGGIWSDGGVGGTFNPGATTLNATWTAPAGFVGTAVLTLTTTGGSCSTSGSKNQIVKARPVPSFVSSPSGDICAGSIVTYSTETGQSSYAWTYTGTVGVDYTIVSGGTGTSSGVTLKWLTPGIKSVSINYNAGGCNAITATSTSNNVNARPSASITSTNTSICNPGSTAITGTVTAIGAWTLTLSDGSTATGSGNGAFSISVSPTATTTYTLTSIADANCSSISTDLTGSTVVTVNEPVVITSQPDVSQTACATFPVSFTVAATGSGLTYQWYKDGSPLSDNANITGSNAPELDIDQAGTADAGTYTVVVSGLSPCGPVTSGNAVLIVNQEIVINTQPAPQTVCAGSTATFTVDATGTGVMYQWRKGTVPLTDGANISGSNTATLTIANVTAGDAATNYNVVLTSPGGACPQANSANVKLVVNPIPVVTATPSSQNICSGSATSIALSGNVSGETYSWTVTQSGASGASAGTGNSITQTLTATGTSDGTVTYHITPTANGCPGTTIDVIVTVHPTPVVTATPSSQVLCSGSSTSIALNGNVSGETYSWTVTQSGASGASVGSGNSIAQTLIATGASDGTVTYHITPTANGCPGTTIDVIVTVHPTPVVTATPSSQVLCSGSSTSIALNGNVSGETYSWTVTQSGASGASAGNGNSITQTLTATGTSDGTVTYHITPTANGCPGTTIDVIVTVHPTPVVTATPSSQVLCSGSSTSIALSGNVSGETYSWTVTQSGASGASVGSGNSIAQTLIATGASDGTVTYHITPTANGCPGTAIDVTITVHPLVTITPLTQEICNGASISTIAISGLPTGAITSWTRDNPPVSPRH